MSENTHVFYSFFSSQHGVQTVYEDLEFVVSQLDVKEHAEKLVHELNCEEHFCITHFTVFAIQPSKPDEAFSLTWERVDTVQ